MKNLKGACVFAQSGGPTSVINASAAGIISEALKHENITGVYGSANGIKGIMDDRLFDFGKEDEREIELLKYTPSSALGSVRYKLVPPEVSDVDYKIIAAAFEKRNVRYFLYNGGNDSMDTCAKISRYFDKIGYDCNVIGVPKTIDNDIYGTDHCPGYASAVKYIATTLTEINLDAKVYDTGAVVVLEVMGRNTGWLAAGAALASVVGYGADLIYLPEAPFSVDNFLGEVDRVLSANNNKCIAVVSEGIKTADGKYVGEYAAAQNDKFGHTQLGGISAMLARLVKERTGIKTRAIELSLMQRCAAHLASKTDIDEAFEAGRQAVLAAVNGESGKMVCFERAPGAQYKCLYRLLPVELSANAVKYFPSEWITGGGSGISDEYIKYALPLIDGENVTPTEFGLPRYAKLKKIRVE